MLSRGRYHQSHIIQSFQSDACLAAKNNDQKSVAYISSRLAPNLTGSIAVLSVGLNLFLALSLFECLSSDNDCDVNLIIIYK